MEWAIATLVEAGPDAIQLSPGEAPYLQRVQGQQKPALVLRTDVANVYGEQLPRHLFSELVAGAVEQAVRLDAACVSQPAAAPGSARAVPPMRPERLGVAGGLRPGRHAAHGRAARDAAERARAYGVDGDVEKIVPLVRQAVELGADVIKADPTDDIGDYDRVIEIAGNIPVLVRGGGRASDEEILRRTEAVMDQGAAGIVYGRNVIQHEDPAAMTKALMAIVHEGVSAVQALALLRG